MEQSGRWKVLDEFRGCTVFLLIVFNSFYPFADTPVWLKHAQGNGFAAADLIAPLFMFSVGLSYALSFQKRVQCRGAGDAFRHVLSRNALLVIFGILGEMVFLEKIVLNLGVLGAIGLSSVLALPMMLCGTRFKLGAACALLSCWQILNWLGVRAASEGLGGPLACLAWASVILVAASLADIRNAPASRFACALLSAWLMSHLLHTIASHFVPVNKHLVTASYILLSLELSVAAFFLFWLKNEMFAWHTNILAILGANPLLLYMISGIVSLAVSYFLPLTTPISKIMPVAAAETALMVGIACVLNKKKIYLKL